ncbi:MAG: SCP2 sterol-binding domain-containing protein [Alphaproteobacteria bacterium]|nr:SCP2 sterol-binding domain-containing protein [Alphaproteobacteria bacterium]
MKSGGSLTPPLSPVLLAGMIARPLPLAPLQPVMAMTLAALLRRHPRMFEALRQLGSPAFVIEPLDLPFVFHLQTGPDEPSLRVVRDATGLSPAATIRGPLLLLIDLMEGRIDGDAMFFSRELGISGDTEAVVALRNAVDGAGVDVRADLGSFLGPLRQPVETAFGFLAGLGQRMALDLETVRAAAIAPSLRRSDALAARLRTLEERLAAQQPRGRAKTPGAA